MTQYYSDSVYPFTIGVDGRRKKLDSKHLERLIKGETVTVYDREWERELEITADLARYDGNGPLACFIKDKSLCSRQLLLYWQETAMKDLHIHKCSVTQSFYVFNDENFRGFLSTCYDSIQPLDMPELIGVFASWRNGAQNESPALYYDRETHQFSFRLSSADALKLADEYGNFRGFISDNCKREGLRAFFIPKMNHLPPNGTHVSFEADGMPEPDFRAALKGVYTLAVQLALATCSHVNSYKRLTPQRITAGWDSPCYVEISHNRNPNAIVWLENGGSTLTFGQADAYSNIYISLAVYLGMLHFGIKECSVSNEEWQAMQQGTTRMPTSLNVACRRWEEGTFGREFLGQTLAERLVAQSREEWITYCDIAHPWELLRGLDYEEHDN